MNIVCQECESVYVANEIPQELVCLCKSKKFKVQ